MDSLINEGVLAKLVKQAVDDRVDKLFEDNMTGRTIGINEFRKKYCGGKSPDWVRTFIFDKYPEISLENDRGHGFVLHARGGQKTIIWEKAAAEWIDKHYRQIDWDKKFGEQ